MERAKQLGKIDARCILETACNLIDHAGRVTYELRGVAIAIHLNGVDSCQRLCDSLGDLRHDIDVAIGEKAVNYCLIYGTSETDFYSRSCQSLVNYYLDYRTSETRSVA